MNTLKSHQTIPLDQECFGLENLESTAQHLSPTSSMGAKPNYATQLDDATPFSKGGCDLTMPENTNDQKTCQVRAECFASYVSGSMKNGQQESTLSNTAVNRSISTENIEGAVTVYKVAYSTSSPSSYFKSEGASDPLDSSRGSAFYTESSSSLDINSEEFGTAKRATTPEESSLCTTQATASAESDNRALNTSSISQWEIVPIDGKGLGMVAKVPIPRGTLIFVEAPLLRFDRYSETCTSQSQFDWLSPENKASILSLHNYRPELGDFMGIIWTNAIPLMHSKSKNLAGLFVIASRINHDCNPNTHHTWFNKRGQMTTYATKNIGVGEEITSSYLSAHVDFETRQSQMKKLLGFACQCRLCSLPLKERCQSDDRVNEIRSLQAQCENFERLAIPSELGLKIIRRLLYLYDEEGITGRGQAEAYRIAYLLAMRDQGGLRAVVFAERSEQVYSAIKGADSPEARGMRKLGMSARQMLPCANSNILGGFRLEAQSDISNDVLFGGQLEPGLDIRG